MALIEKRPGAGYGSSAGASGGTFPSRSRTWSSTPRWKGCATRSGTRTHATLAVVHLVYRPDEVTLVLQADFPTVPPPAAGSSGTGTGLALLRGRAEQLGGQP
jgi:hypothetical protein